MSGFDDFTSNFGANWEIVRLICSISSSCPAASMSRAMACATMHEILCLNCRAAQGAKKNGGSREAEPVAQSQQQEKQEYRSKDGFYCPQRDQYAPLVVVFQ